MTLEGGQLVTVTVGKVMMMLLMTSCGFTMSTSEDVTIVDVLVGGVASLPCASPPTTTSRRQPTLITFLRTHPTHVVLYRVDLRHGRPTHWAARGYEARAFVKVGASYGHPRTNNHPTLQLDPTNLQDLGQYQCHLDYKHGPSIVHSLFLNVFDPPKKLSIQSDLDPNTEVTGSLGPLSLGDQVTLSCKVTGGDPQPNVTWWAGSQRLVTPCDLLGSHVTQCDLTLGPLTREDEGREVTCRAANSDLTPPLQQRVPIDLHYAPQAWIELSTDDQTREQMKKNDNTKKKGHNNKKEEGETKKVTKPDPLIMVVKEGGGGGGRESNVVRAGVRVLLRCYVNASPRATAVVWTRDNVTLPGAPKQSTSSAGSLQVFQLEYPQVSRSGQQGVYRCRVTNQVAEVTSAPLNLQVKDTNEGVPSCWVSQSGGMITRVLCSPSGAPLTHTTYTLDILHSPQDHHTPNSLIHKGQPQEEPVFQLQGVKVESGQQYLLRVTTRGYQAGQSTPLTFNYTLNVTLSYPQPLSLTQSTLSPAPLSLTQPTLSPPSSVHSPTGTNSNSSTQIPLAPSSLLGSSSSSASPSSSVASSYLSSPSISSFSSSSSSVSSPSLILPPVSSRLSSQSVPFAPLNPLLHVPAASRLSSGASPTSSSTSPSLPHTSFQSLTPSFSNSLSSSSPPTTSTESYFLDLLYSLPSSSKTFSVPIPISSPVSSTLSMPSSISSTLSMPSSISSTLSMPSFVSSFLPDDSSTPIPSDLPPSSSSLPSAIKPQLLSSSPYPQVFPQYQDSSSSTPSSSSSDPQVPRNSSASHSNSSSPNTQNASQYFSVRHTSFSNSLSSSGVHSHSSLHSLPSSPQSHNSLPPYPQSHNSLQSLPLSPSTAPPDPSVAPYVASAVGLLCLVSLLAFLLFMRRRAKKKTEIEKADLETGELWKKDQSVTESLISRDAIPHSPEEFKSSPAFLSSGRTPSLHHQPPPPSDTNSMILATGNNEVLSLLVPPPSIAPIASLTSLFSLTEEEEQEQKEEEMNAGGRGLEKGKGREERKEEWKESGKIDIKGRGTDKRRGEKRLHLFNEDGNSEEISMQIINPIKERRVRFEEEGVDNEH